MSHPEPGLALASLPGLSALWEETKGDSRVAVAILDGPVDRTSPNLSGALVEQYTLDGDAIETASCSFRHGSEIASIILGQHDTPAPGIAPGCRGISIPVFECFPAGSAGALQTDLARAIDLARELGAKVVNISAGQQASRGTADAELLDAVRDCAAEGVLIVAAAGNDGCNCLHVPAALPNVLAVGAMTRDGRPLAASNWGAAYQSSGILAPGQNIPVAAAAGSVALRTGTSYATAIASGVVGLLLSRQLQRGRTADPFLVRDALLNTALGCDHGETDCRRFLAGRLNIPDAISYLDRWSSSMTDESQLDGPNPGESQPMFNSEEVSVMDDGQLMLGNGHNEAAPLPRQGYPSAAEVEPSACAACRGEQQLVYALGQLGYDLGTEAGLDAFRQRMAHALGIESSAANPLNQKQLLQFFRATKNEPWHHTGLLWTLNQSGSPIYVLRPEGPFAARTYRRLLKSFREQCRKEDHPRRADQVAVPGVITGRQRLLNGLVVDVINPDLRGLCNWNRQALIEALFAARGGPLSDEQKEELHRFLDRIYHELQNRGVRPEHRVLNYAGTNLFEPGKILENLGDKRTLDTIHVERSQICRPGSDCWDIVLSFFNPNHLQPVSKIYRYTVDVSAAIPVTVGRIRSWEARTR